MFQVNDLVRDKQNLEEKTKSLSDSLQENDLESKARRYEQKLFEQLKLSDERLNLRIKLKSQKLIKKN